jgi:hypothetical protein
MVEREAAAASALTKAATRPLRTEFVEAIGAPLKLETCFLGRNLTHIRRSFLDGEIANCRRSTRAEWSANFFPTTRRLQRPLARARRRVANHQARAGRGGDEGGKRRCSRCIAECRTGCPIRRLLPPSEDSEPRRRERPSSPSPLLVFPISTSPPCADKVAQARSAEWIAIARGVYPSRRSVFQCP